jgi:UDP-GlcNAc:undecaprenyl-phosphate GlcNAc-1-phosphate transferase
MTYILLSLGFVSGFAALNLTPLVRNLALRWGIVDAPDHKRKLHNKLVPRLGGAAILLSYLSAFVITSLGFRNAELVLPHGSVAAGILLAVCIVFLAGLIDDLISLKPWQKLASQFGAAAIAYGAGIQIHLIRNYTLDPWIGFPATILWLLACTNAFNLIDGVDGLAAGAGLFATLTVVIAAITQRDAGLAIATVPLAGSLLGFLRYNFNPASIFLGDCGSLTVGFLLGCCGVLWGEKAATLLGMVAPMMAMLIPLLDMTISVFRRLLRGRPVLEGDRRHIHHRLLEKGFTPRGVVLLLYACCAVSASISLIQDSLNQRAGGLIVILFCAGAYIGIQHLQYAEFGMAARLLLRGAIPHAIDVQCRLEQFEASLNNAGDLDSWWAVIEGFCGDFGFTGVRAQVQGRVLQTVPHPELDRPEQERKSWEIHIPLPDDQYLNLYQNPAAEKDPAAQTGFATVLERSLERRARKDAAAMVGIAAAGARASGPVRLEG